MGTICSSDRVAGPSLAPDTVLFETSASKPETIKRKEEDIIVLQFKSRPLGFVLTSARNGYQAFVTKTAPKQNPVVGHGRLKFAKLLKINERDVEYEPIEEITKEILRAITIPPMTLTFCAPDGLKPYEVPDDEVQKHITTEPGIGRTS